MLETRKVYADLDALLYLAALRVIEDEITVKNSLEMIDTFVKGRVANLGVCDITYVMTHPKSGKGGRYDVYPEYQGGRTENEKTYIHTALIQQLCKPNAKIHGNPVIVTEDLEADDVIVKGLYDNPNSIALSDDKDLKQVQGTHVSIRSDKVVETDALGYIEKDKSKYLFTGITGFIYQIVTGDQADGVPGLVFEPKWAAMFMPTKAQEKQLANKEEVTGKPKTGPATGFAFMLKMSQRETPIKDVFKILGTMGLKDEAWRNAQLVYMQRGIDIRTYVQQHADDVITAIVK